MSDTLDLTPAAIAPYAIPAYERQIIASVPEDVHARMVALWRLGYAQGVIDTLPPRKVEKS